MNLNFSLPAPVFLRASPGSAGWGRRSRVPGRGELAAASPFSSGFVVLAGLCILATTQQQPQQTTPGGRGERASPVPARSLPWPGWIARSRPHQDRHRGRDREERWGRRRVGLEGAAGGGHPPRRDRNETFGRRRRRERSRRDRPCPGVPGREGAPAHGRCPFLPRFRGCLLQRPENVQILPKPEQETKEEAAQVSQRPLPRRIPPSPSPGHRAPATPSPGGPDPLRPGAKYPSRHRPAASPGAPAASLPGPFLFSFSPSKINRIWGRAFRERGGSATGVILFNFSGCGSRYPEPQTRAARERLGGMRITGVQGEKKSSTCPKLKQLNNQNRSLLHI